MADKSIKIALILTAVDKMTAVINKANANAKKAFEFGKDAAIGGAILAAPIVYATKKAIDFETAMSNVAKVADLDKKSQAFRDMGNDVLKTSDYLAVSATEVAKLYASLTTGGTGQSDLQKVAIIAGEAAVAFEMTQGAAGDAFSVMRNAMGLSIDEAKKAFDATNAITNKYGGKAPELLEFMSKGGASVASTLKLSASAMEVFGRKMIQLGTPFSEAGTVMQRFRAGLYNNKEAMDLFNKAGGGSDGMIAVLEAAKKTGDPFAWFKSHNFGEYGSQLTSLANNTGSLREMLSFVGNENNYLNSSTQEFNSAMDTAGKRLERAKIAFENVSIQAGDNLLPILTRLLDTINPIISNLSAWIQQNPELTGTIIKMVGGAALLSLTVSGLSFAFGGVMKVVAGATTLLKLLKVGQAAYLVATAAGTTVTGGLTAALAAMNLTFLANPIGLTIIAIAAFIALLVLAYNKVDWFRAGIDGVIAVSKLLAQIYIGLGKVIIGALTFDWNLFKSGAEQSAKAVNSIMNGGIKKSFTTAYDASIKTSAAAEKAEKLKENTQGIPSLPSLPSTLSTQVISPASGNTSPSINFAPVINISGGATKNEGASIAKQIQDQFSKCMREYEAKQKRLAY